MSTRAKDRNREIAILLLKWTAVEAKKQVCKILQNDTDSSIIPELGDALGLHGSCEVSDYGDWETCRYKGGDSNDITVMPQHELFSLDLKVKSYNIIISRLLMSKHKVSTNFLCFTSSWQVSIQNIDKKSINLLAIVEYPYLKRMALLS